MPSKLERLLQSIDPARTYDETARRADDAVNSFSVDRGMIKDWDEFKTCLVRFFRHVEGRVLRLKHSPYDSLKFDWGRCTRVLMQIYGRNGEKEAFDMVRTGNEGGLYDVLRQLGQKITEQYAQNEVSARIYEWWSGLSRDEQFAAMTEYLATYGHLLPSELTEGNAVRIRANFSKVLEEHPRMLQRIRHTGR